MPLQHRIADAINLRIDNEPTTGFPVIEIEFKFIRYRIVIDDDQKGLELYKLLQVVLSKDAGKKETSKLPEFYRKK